MTYLAFTEIKDTGKTKVWSVDNTNDGSHLGKVSWHGPWRKYVLHVVPTPTIWSSDCLLDVHRFIEVQMEQRKLDRRKSQAIAGDLDPNQSLGETRGADVRP